MSLLSIFICAFALLILTLIYWVSSFFRKGPVNVLSDIKFAKDYFIWSFVFIIRSFASYIINSTEAFLKNQRTDVQVINLIESTNVEPSVEESQGSHSTKTEISIMTNLCQLEENQDSFMEFQDSFLRTETDFSYTESSELEEKQDSFMEFQESFVRCDTDFSYTDFSEILSQDVELIEPQEESYFESQLSIEREDVFIDENRFIKVFKKGSFEEEEIIQSIMKNVVSRPILRGVELEYPFNIAFYSDHSIYVKSILKKAIQYFAKKKDTSLYYMLVRIGTYLHTVDGDVVRDSESGKSLPINIPYAVRENPKIKMINHPKNIKEIVDFLSVHSEKYQVSHYKMSIFFRKSFGSHFINHVLKTVKNAKKKKKVSNKKKFNKKNKKA